MKIKNTKRALLMSGLSLMLCMSMLIGSTFAWFTDSVTSAGNKIQAGTLDIDLVDANGESLEGKMIEWKLPEGDTRKQEEILWEPGCTYETEAFYIENKGNLDLKFKFDITGIEGDAKLLKAIEFACEALDLEEGKLLKANEKLGPYTLKGHMKEEAGNEYQGLTIESIAITLVATQATSEYDSFNNTYDANAEYPELPVGNLNGASAVEIDLVTNANEKVGSLVIPAEAVANADSDIVVNVDESDYVGTFTVAAGETVEVYDISVSNLKEDNTEPIKVTLKIPAGLAKDTIKLYHINDEITDFTYDPSTGYVIFNTTSFSPFSVVYDAESEYVAPEVPEGAAVPTATVTYKEEYVGADANIEWGNYGQWSPTAGLDSVLEAAFSFQCPEEVDKKFENWYCDFYVSLSEDLGKNEIFLGGNYGSFGWIGFHNGDLELEANTELPLLGSVTSNPWTYANIASQVGTFLCGVGDVDDALEGATFTVKLRLTNPENEAEFYDVNTVTYTFGSSYSIDGKTHVSTGEELQDAINNGSSDIVLDGDIDLSQGIVIP